MVKYLRRRSELAAAGDNHFAGGDNDSDDEGEQRLLTREP